MVTRFNHAEVFDIIDFCSRFKHLRYVRMRRVSTDRRQEELADDASVYDCLYAYVKQRYPVEETLWGNADVFRISGVPGLLANCQDEHRQLQLLHGRHDQRRVFRRRRLLEGTGPNADFLRDNQ